MMAIRMLSPTEPVKLENTGRHQVRGAADPAPRIRSCGVPPRGAFLPGQHPEAVRAKL
jgi:hypothetical protein